MTTIPLRAMSAGEILDGGFQVYRRHFAVMYLVSLLAAVPIALWGTASSGLTSGSGMTAMGGVAALLVLVALFFLSPLVYAALVELSDRAIMGQEVSAGTGLRLGLSRVGHMIALMMLAGAIFFVPVMFIGVAIPLFAARGGAGPFGVLWVLVMAVLIIMAIVVLPPVMFMAVPALVKERLASTKAFKRGLRLSKGVRGRLWLLSVLVYIIAVLPAFAYGMVEAIAVGVHNASTGSVGVLSPLTQVLLLVVQVAVSALTTPFTVGCMLMAYYDRRVRLEALDVEVASAELVGTT